MFNWLYNNNKKLIEITNLNDLYTATYNQIQEALSNRKHYLPWKRKLNQKRCFVIDFDGDIMATRSKALTQEITSVLFAAKQNDEVLIRLQSPGGAAHAYGYASSQLERIKKAGIKLTVAADLVIASGGYMMACVADKIIAAPYAIIGSVGVVSEFPNFFNFLKNLGIDYKQYTAGKYKRTVSPLGEITQAGEEKHSKDLQEMYQLFRDHVALHRPQVDIDKIATGEHWQAIRAIDLKLVDEISTSEEFITSRFNEFDFVKITYVGDRKTWLEKMGENVMLSVFNQVVNFFLSWGTK